MIKRTLGSVEARIAHLSQKPVENTRLINKWKRIARKMMEENNND